MRVDFFSPAGPGAGPPAPQLQLIVAHSTTTQRGLNSTGSIETMAQMGWHFRATRQLAGAVRAAPSLSHAR